MTKTLATNITNTTKSFLTGLYHLALVGIMGNLPDTFRKKVEDKLNYEIGSANIITNIVTYPSASYLIARNLTSDNKLALYAAGYAFAYSLLEGYIRYDLMDDCPDCPPSLPGLIASIPLFGNLYGKKYIKNLHSRARKNLEQKISEK